MDNSLTGSNKKFLVLGAGAYMPVFVELLTEIFRKVDHSFSIQGFIDSDCGKHGLEIYGYPVLGDISWLMNTQEEYCVASFVNPSAKKELFEQLVGMENLQFPNIIHPSASISITATLGIGNIIGQNVLINAEAKIGNYNHINYSTTIGHNCIIGNYNSLYGSVGLYGSSKVTDQVFVGAGAIIFDQVTLSPCSVVGAGSVVRRDVPESVTVVGNPARAIS